MNKENKNFFFFGEKRSEEKKKKIRCNLSYWAEGEAIFDWPNLDRIFPTCVQ